MRQSHFSEQSRGFLKGGFGIPDSPPGWLIILLPVHAPLDLVASNELAATTTTLSVGQRRIKLSM
jgi:hypothetical protein